LLLLTMIVLFVTTWLALFLSKIVTRPLSALAEATQEISRGRLDYRVPVSAADEIGDLVRSFNRMAEDLESSRRQIEASSLDLSAANAELDQRRRQMETILESIPTGVLSLDAERRVTHVQSGVAAHVSSRGRTRWRPQILSRRAAGRCIPRRSAGGFRSAAAARRSHGHDHQPDGDAVASRSLNVAVTVATLRHQGERSGYVVVFEDLSDLLKAQKQAAWREVARRVAHEIKNPLTPIALSAERIQRHLDRATPDDPASLERGALLR
jgi:two-component system, NtrC family, nitrogen regulation sensor histidine kinase NtrY